MSIDPGYAEFVELLTPGVRRAASIARSLEGRVPNRPKRGEVTAAKQALTVADTQARADEIVAMAIREPDGLLRRMEAGLG